MQFKRAMRQGAYRLHQVYKRWFAPITVGCRALVVRDDAVLLVRHSYQEGWYLPGGTVERGESLRQAVMRELAEECGIEAEDAELSGMFYSEFERRSDHVALFVVRRFRDLPNSPRDPEIAASGFYPMTAMPEGTSPATRRRLAEFAGRAVVTERW